LGEFAHADGERNYPREMITNCLRSDGLAKSLSTAFPSGDHQRRISATGGAKGPFAAAVALAIGKDWLRRERQRSWP